MATLLSNNLVLVATASTLHLLMVGRYSDPKRGVLPYVLAVPALLAALLVPFGVGARADVRTGRRFTTTTGGTCLVFVPPVFYGVRSLYRNAGAEAAAATATEQTGSEMTDPGMQEQAPSGEGDPRDASARTGAGPSPGAGSPLGVRNERGVAAGVRDVVRTVVTSVGRAGNASRVAIGEAFEGPGRALAGRIAAAALSQPRPVADPEDLAAALNEQPRAPLLGGATGAALAAKVARRVGPMRFLARRTPMWLVITAVPALQASVARGAEELALVASHLVHRARAAGLEPDRERVRRAAVQLVSGRPVDPATEPRHTPLVFAWLERALRATLPFSPGVATRNPGSLAREATAVDPSTLRGVTPLLAGEEV